MLAHLQGNERAQEIIERDDGFVEVTNGADVYFGPFRRWPAHQRRAMRFVRGRVLDVGAGAGRVALHLQERGHEVVAIDISPLAVEVCRRRGVRDARVCAFEDIDASLGTFDTVVMFGNNFGLFGGARKAARMLRRLHQLTTSNARIVAESRDVYATDDPAHLEYHERNRRRGRMAGQLRLRVRHRSHATPWFDYLIVSADEMGELVAGTGWHVARLIRGEAGIYAAVIGKTN
ncbi:MAG: methyltransferase domain-containing protein [Gaiellaceae bacterium]